jgi:hypothetical protein
VTPDDGPVEEVCEIRAWRQQHPDAFVDGKENMA